MTTQVSNSSLQEAQQALADFENSTAVSAWPYLDKRQVIAEMRSRLSDPFQVNQGGQPFCGPASILFEFVRKQPLRYVQICRSLFETGSFQGKTRQIEASSQLRQSQGRLRMSQADWMVLATWRESENLIFPVQPDEPNIIRNLAGITKPWEMVGWTREILGYANVKNTITYIFGEVHALNEAASIIDSGGVVFALITAEGLLDNGTPPLLPCPNHWVSLLGNMSIQKRQLFRNSGHVSLDLYTWGSKKHIDKTEAHFEDYFWGIVTGWE